MFNNFILTMQNFYQEKVITYINTLYQYPIKLITLMIDIAIVTFLIVQVIKIARNTKALQLVKGLVLLVIAIPVCDILNLNILHYILTSFTTYGVIILIIIFQPELRRALEEIGSRGKFTRYLGIDKDIETKIKENIYKVVIATTELASTKTGALIVFERDIKLRRNYK